MDRAIIVDDSEQFLASAQKLLEIGGLSVVGIASSGDGALGVARERRPNVALVDIDLGPENGLDVARALASLPMAPVIVLISTHAEEDVAEQVATSPAAGFVPKSRLDADAVRAFLA